MKLSLSKKIVGSITVIYLTLTWLLFTQLSNIHLQESSIIEKELAHKDVERILLALDNLRADLVAHHNEWSLWDENYKFISGKNEDFKETYLNYESLQGGTDHFIIVNEKYKSIAAGKLNNEKEIIDEIDKESFTILKDLLDRTKQLNEEEKEKIISGLVVLNKTPYFFCLGKIRTVDSANKPLGGIIFTKELSTEVFNFISQQTQLPIKSLTKGSNDFVETYYKFLKSDPDKSNISLEFIDDNVKATGLIKDINNNPALIIQTYAPEQIYTRSKTTLNIVLKWIIFFALFTVIITLIVIRSGILKPISIITKELESVTKNKDSGIRLSVQKGEEFGIIAKNFNSALESLQQAETELLISRDSAIAANTAKSQFLASVSHELRTPIHGILGMLRMMFKNEKSSSKLSMIQMSYNTTQGLLETINDLLDMSKAEAGKLGVEPKEFTIRHIIRDALQTVGPRVHEKHHLELICNIDPKLPKVLWGDPNRVRQILMNLLGNAVKFTPKGVIELSVSAENATPSYNKSNNDCGLVLEDGVEVLGGNLGGNRNGGGENLEVRGDANRPSWSSALHNGSVLHNLIFRCRDTGIGIAKEQLGKIFEAYEQADSSKAGKPQGTGLGLNVVQQLVKTMGGELKVNSEVGVGSEFTAIIPMQVIEDSVVKEDVIEPVFCVGDKESFTELVADSLKNRNVDVRHGERKNLLRFNTDDEFVGNTFIVDGKMLRETAFWAELKESRSKYNKKIIIIATPAELVHRDRLELLGISAIILRPFIPDDLVDTLTGRKRGMEVQLAETEMTANARIDGLEKLHVLVADDTKTNQIILANLLEEAGHAVTIVGDGQEMIELVEAGSRFDLILTDVQMPRIDGLTATKMIRERERRLIDSGANGYGLDYKGVPIVAVTAHAFNEEHEKMKEAGVNGVLTKPIDPAKLRKMMEGLFEERINNASSTELYVLSEVEGQIGRGGNSVDVQVQPSVGGKAVATIDLGGDSDRPSWSSALHSSSALHIFESKSAFIDINNLKQRVNGKDSLVKMIVGTFLDSKGELMEEIKRAMIAGDRKDLSSRAHAFKGTLLDVGAKEVADIAAWLEKNAAGEDSEILERVIDTLEVKSEEVARDAMQYV